MSISPSEMPFQQAEEQSMKKGSTTSSLDLAPSPAAIDTLSARRDGVPEVRTGLRVGVRKCANQDFFIEALHQVLKGWIVAASQHGGGDGPDMHGVAHGSAGATITSDGFNHH